MKTLIPFIVMLLMSLSACGKNPPLTDNGAVSVAAPAREAVSGVVMIKSPITSNTCISIRDGFHQRMSSIDDALKAAKCPGEQEFNDMQAKEENVKSVSKANASTPESV